MLKNVNLHENLIQKRLNPEGAKVRLKVYPHSILSILLLRDNEPARSLTTRVVSGAGNVRRITNRDPREVQLLFLNQFSFYSETMPGQ